MTDAAVTTADPRQRALEKALGGRTLTQDEMLLALRAPFPEEAISLLPKPLQRDDQNKAQCEICNTYVAVRHIHLSYIGHAALTDRLLTVDPCWNWEPFTFDDDSPLRISKTANEINLWMKLTVGTMTRIGVGSVPSSGLGSGDAEKQLIGDALRNAGMRFGMALELWSKDELESLIGNEVITRRTDRKRAPRGSVPVTGSTSSRDSRPPADPNALTARDRNKIIRALAHLDEPVTEMPAVLAYVTAIMDRSENLTDLAELTVPERDILFNKLGIA